MPYFLSLYSIRALFFSRPISHSSLLPHHIMVEHIQIAIPNTQEPNKPFTLIHISNQNTIKLTSTNYLSWKLQIEALFIGYDLKKFIDGSHPCPPTTIIANNTTTPNPEYHTCMHQDKLIFDALISWVYHSIYYSTHSTCLNVSWSLDHSCQYLYTSLSRPH